MIHSTCSHSISVPHSTRPSYVCVDCGAELSELPEPNNTALFVLMCVVSLALLPLLLWAIGVSR